MKTEVCIFTLNGNRAAVRDYANTIASMSASNCNAYVMAFDKDDEILWTVQAGDDIDEVKAAINWQGVRRVEIYDHSADGTYKIEQVYITSRKSLNGYTRERSASEFVVVGNTTQYTADNWQKAEADESDNSDSQSDDNSEGKLTATEPLALAQKVAKVAESVKTYAAQGARRIIRQHPGSREHRQRRTRCTAPLLARLAKSRRRAFTRICHSLRINERQQRRRAFPE